MLREDIPVHPRVCGEQRRHTAGVNGKPGSSPRVRGTDSRCVTDTSDSRFIPACAGNRQPLCDRYVRFPVHPRVCGEQFFLVVPRPAVDGSSPRVRGTAPARCNHRDPIRFIPACAGNSVTNRNNSKIKSVHPRVCGEQPTLASCRAQMSGSSPRVRGTGDLIDAATAEGRFIPACAGNRFRS